MYVSRDIPWPTQCQTPKFNTPSLSLPPCLFVPAFCTASQRWRRTLCPAVHSQNGCHSCTMSPYVACHRATEEETSVEELKAYFGFMVLMGINQLPEIRDYWAKDPSFHYSPIADCIACDRFERSHATCTLLSMMFCLLVGMQLNHRGGQCYLRLGDPVQFYLRGSSTTSQADRRRGRGRRWGWM